MGEEELKRFDNDGYICQSDNQDCKFYLREEVDVKIESLKSQLAQARAKQYWNCKELKGWDIVGMNHYHVGGVRYLFCSMQKDGKSITSEGHLVDNVFYDLRRKALPPEASSGEGEV